MAGVVKVGLVHLDDANPVIRSRVLVLLKTLAVNDPSTVMQVCGCIYVAPLNQPSTLTAAGRICVAGWLRQDQAFHSRTLR